MEPNNNNKSQLNPEAPAFVPSSNPFLPMIRRPSYVVNNYENSTIGGFTGPVMRELNADDIQSRPQDSTETTNSRMPQLLQALWKERLFVTHFLALLVAFAHLVVFIIVALNQ